MKRLVGFSATLAILATSGCARPWANSTGQPEFSEHALRTEPLASRIDQGSWMVSQRSKVWKVYENRMGQSERHLGFVEENVYRQARGGPEFPMFKVTTRDRNDQIGHIDSLGRAVRYEPRRDGGFEKVDVGTNTLEENLSAIFGTARPIRVEPTSERRLAFESLDVNGDSVLQRNEWEPFGRRTGEVDANGDGNVDFEEFETIETL